MLRTVLYVFRLLSEHAPL